MLGELLFAVFMLLAFGFPFLIGIWAFIICTVDDVFFDGKFLKFTKKWANNNFKSEDE